MDCLTKEHLRKIDPEKVKSLEKLSDEDKKTFCEKLNTMNKTFEEEERKMKEYRMVEKNMSLDDIKHMSETNPTKRSNIENRSYKNYKKREKLKPKINRLKNKGEDNESSLRRFIIELINEENMTLEDMKKL
jgi:hypothetical protein